MEREVDKRANFLVKRKWNEEVSLEFAQRICVLENLSSDFKVMVSDLRDFLEQTKSEMDAEELRIRSEEELWEPLGPSELVDIAERIVTGYMNRAFSKMSEIAAHFTPEEHLLHRSYFQRHLHPLLLLSPFADRAYHKPLGYPGDYQMMNMIYGQHDQGESLFASLINRYSCRSTAARAVASRVPFLLQKFDRTLKRVLRERESVKILSVGSGPAQEIQELIGTNINSDRCRVNLIDILPEALFHCQEKIFDLKVATGNGIQVDYLNRSVRELIRFHHALDALKGQDFIYAVGLCDYLPLHVAKRVIQNLYLLLSDGGELVIGNFDISNPTRFYMEYALEWYLLYRNRDEMFRLAEEIPFAVSPTVVAEEGGVQLYLIVEKSERAGGSLCEQRETAILNRKA